MTLILEEIELLIIKKHNIGSIPKYLYRIK